MITRTSVMLGVLALACAGSRVDAGSHLWRIQELFSNADGTIQFIEMKECCGAGCEACLVNKPVFSVATGKSFPFPTNPCDCNCSNPATGCTSFAHLLLATQRFANLPGAPTPDYIIPENFFAIDGDTVHWHIYPAAPMTYGPGELPTDGVHSLQCLGAMFDPCTDNEVVVNSPTNFHGESGSVTVPCEGDLDGSGAVDVADLVELILAWGPNPGHPADLNGDDAISVDDLVTLILAWGDC
jgi:hypothetical protein